MQIILCGRVQSGKNDASRWLSIFNEAYSRKLGTPIYPGSLNLALDRAFDWSVPQFKPHMIQFRKEEYGGERDIMLLPCILANLDHRKAWLWSTTAAAKNRPDPHVVEVICGVKLRETHALSDGAFVQFELSA